MGSHRFSPPSQRRTFRSPRPFQVICRWCADAARIGHVFANLLNNSLRHTPSGGHVQVGARTDGSFVEFTVADDGMGIPKQYAHRIFEKFFRVPGQPGSTGSGLGLALSKDIVEAHGGQIRADPANGRGTIVRFTLRRADAPKQMVDDETAAIGELLVQ